MVGEKKVKLNWKATLKKLRENRVRGKRTVTHAKSGLVSVRENRKPLIEGRSVRDRRKGPFVGACRHCDLMVAQFDGLYCPRCGGSLSMKIPKLRIRDRQQLIRGM